MAAEKLEVLIQLISDKHLKDTNDIKTEFNGYLKIFKWRNLLEALVQSKLVLWRGGCGVLA